MKGNIYKADLNLLFRVFDGIEERRELNGSSTSYYFEVKGAIEAIREHIEREEKNNNVK
jgi:hypothetical protein